MSDYFSGINNNEEKQFIPPDYSESEEEAYDVDDSDDEDSITSYDESEEEELLEYLHGSTNSNKEEKIEKKQEEEKVSSSPFSTSTPPSWGGWGSSNQQNNSSSFWSNNNQSKPTWGGFSGSFGQPTTVQQQKEQIDRNKKVIFCDFLDCIVETYQSNGQSGLLPRDIYDLKPRFDVWAKLSAFNPERIYVMVPRNLLPSTNGPDAWTMTLNYFCCSLSAFIRVPFNCCQILVQQILGQPKENIINSIISDPNFPVPKEKIVSIGIYSGENGQSNRDIMAAQICGIDYIDLNRLINNMY